MYTPTPVIKTYPRPNNNKRKTPHEERNFHEDYHHRPPIENIGDQHGILMNYLKVGIDTTDSNYSSNSNSTSTSGMANCEMEEEEVELIEIKSEFPSDQNQVLGLNFNSEVVQMQALPSPPVLPFEKKPWYSIPEKFRLQFDYIGHSNEENSIAWKCRHCGDCVEVSSMTCSNATVHLKLKEHGMATDETQSGGQMGQVCDFLNNFYEGAAEEKHNISSAASKDTQESSCSFLQPGYVIPKKYISHYDYVGHNNMTSITWKCKYCGDCVKVGISSSGNAERHLNRKDHQLQVIRNNELTVMSIIKKSEQINKYEASHPKQQKFDEDVLDVLSNSEGINSRVCNNTGFINLVKHLDPRISVKSSLTYSRKLRDLVKLMITPVLKEKLAVREKILHVSIDLWNCNSARNTGIQGFRTYFIDDNWNFVSRFIAFKNVGPTLIIPKLEDVLNEFSLKVDMVGYVVRRNCSDMIDLLNMNDVFKHKWYINDQEESAETESLFLQSPDGEKQNFKDDVEDSYSNYIDATDENPKLQQGLEMYTETKYPEEVSQLICCVSSIQLAIKEAILTDDKAYKLLQYVNELMVFFQRRRFWNNELKRRTSKNINLPGKKIRWKNLIHSLTILSDEAVFETTQKLILEIRSIELLEGCGKSQKLLPGILFNQKYEYKELVLLLKPFMDVIDKLLTDSISSSLVIYNVASAYRALLGTEATHFPILKSNLLIEMKTRLGSTLSSTEFVIATVIDPRQKLAPFKKIWSLSTDSRLEIPSEETVIQMLSTELRQLVNPTEVEPVPMKQERQDNYFDPEFAMLEDLHATCDVARFELNRYLEEGRAPDEPLTYWKNSCTKYPNLSRIARKFLSIPVCLGSLDRILSLEEVIVKEKGLNGLEDHSVADLILYREFRE